MTTLVLGAVAGVDDILCPVGRRGGRIARRSQSLAGAAVGVARGEVRSAQLHRRISI